MRQNAMDSKNAGQQNEILVLRLLREHGTLSQAQLCNLGGLGSSTVSYIVGRLRDKKLIIENRSQRSGRGAKPVIIGINPHGLYIVGVEIRPTKLLIGLFDFNCQLIDTVNPSLDRDHSVENVLAVLQINLLGLIAKHGIDQEQLLGTGITVSGSISPDGVIRLSSSLGWKNVSLKKLLAEHINCPVQVYPTRVRILAEIGLDPDLSSKNVLYLNVGDGVGGTILSDGQLIHGATDSCGELGHIIVDPDGPICGCGNKGCLEALVSGPAVAGKIQSDINNGAETLLRSMITKSSSPEQVIRQWAAALSRADTYAISVLGHIADHLSRVAAICINCFDPSIIMLAGYVCAPCIDAIAETIYKRIQTDVFNSSSREIQIYAAKAGREALIRGAGAAILRSSCEV